MAEDALIRCCDRQFWMDLTVSFSLVLFAGLTSGLSLGLLSHSKVDLEVLVKAGLPKDQKNAARVLPIIKNEGFLLCTLLIAKSLATEALPLFLDRILPFWYAILVSIILVVAFVEVIPQVVCTRHGLSFGAKFTWFVRFLLLILYPVAYPVSKVNHQPFMHISMWFQAGKGGDLTDDETTSISGALGMVEKTARDAMTPLYKAFSLDINSKLDVYAFPLPLPLSLPPSMNALQGVRQLVPFRRAEAVPRGSWPHGSSSQVSGRNPSNGEREVLEVCETPSRSMDNALKPARHSQVFSRQEQIHGSISNEELESLRSRFMDEEVVGIITMEDVLEELHHSPAFVSPPPSYVSPSSPRVQSTRSFSNVRSSQLVHQVYEHQTHILQQITPPHSTKPNPWPQIHLPLQITRRETPFRPPRTWRIRDGAKGFPGRESVAKKGNTSTNKRSNNDDDDKIPDVVWERMIARILFNVGVPLAVGFALLKGFDVVIENGTYVPKWLPFLTTFITFGASALGIVYGSLSTSLDAEEEGSFLGFEQLQRNWVEMWKEEDGA